jgi:signal peptidase I
MTARRFLSLVGFTLLCAVWFFMFRPAALGGPAAYVIVSGSSMEPNLHTGDLVVLRERAAYGVGDVVTYPVPDGSPGAGNLVIHRITGGSAQSGFTTQGDNRDVVDDWHPTAADVVGRQWFIVPRLGGVLSRLRSPATLAALAGGGTVVVLLLRKPREDESSATVPELVDAP